MLDRDGRVCAYAMEADENRFPIRNKRQLGHITSLFITMAADKSATGYK